MTTGEEQSPRLVLGRYRLIEPIGAGGTAQVWRGIDEASGRPVAIKLLHPHLVPDATSRARLASEARAVAGLHHPGIIRLLAVDAGERPAVVLELVTGESLSARIARTGPLSPSEVATLGADLADGLYHAHTRGVIHRDVKPGNVILGADGKARLVDFGIARLLGDSIRASTQTGTVMGTLRYMAPEQLQGEPVGPRADLYGLGAVLYEAATGRLPYEQSMPIGLLEAQMSQPPPVEGIDRGLASVILACLQPRVDDRPLHAGRVADALHAWLAGDPMPALGPQAGLALDRDAPTQAVSLAPTMDPAPSTARVGATHGLAGRLLPPASRRLRMVAAGAAAGAAVLVVSLGLLAIGPSPRSAVAVSSLRPTPAATPAQAPAAQPAIVRATPKGHRHGGHGRE